MHISYMLSNFFIIIHLEGSLNTYFMVCPYIVSRDHKKLVKPHELQIINIREAAKNI